MTSQDEAPLDRLGWQRFAYDPTLSNWVGKVLPQARAAVADPVNAHWLRCGGTWFAGVNVLANAADGSIAGSGPLRGQSVDYAKALSAREVRWDEGQISVIHPGYPRQGEETDAAFGYRLRRDAAHVDGLLRVGPDNLRMIREPHGFVLGIPLNESDPDASPLVVWEGSHLIMRAAFRAALQGYPAANWADVDMTDAYHEARRKCFETCARVTVSARPGEAYLIHRLALHGVSPWQAAAQAAPDGRMIAYFRPQMGSVADWLDG